MERNPSYGRLGAAIWVREIARLAALAAGGLLTILGVTIAVTPLPFGAFLMAAGLVTLISVSPTVARVVRDLRLRFRIVDRGLATAERFSPAFLAKVLRSTMPLPQPMPAAPVRA